MTTTTIKKIMEILQRQNGATALELSRILGKTRANIHHHIMDMMSNDLVDVIGKRVNGRGRPEYVYGKSRHQLRDGMDHLSAALLDLLDEDYPGDDSDFCIRSLAERLRRRIIRDKDGSRWKRLTHLVNALNDSNYYAHWEAAASGAKVVLGHCPYESIIDEHPELCQVDFHLIEGYVMGNIWQTTKFESPELNFRQCVFLIS